jgi:hypothetical protein
VNIFIARDLSNDDLETGPFELASMIVAMEPEDSDDSLDRDGREEV